MYILNLNRIRWTFHANCRLSNLIFDRGVEGGNKDSTSAVGCDNTTNISSNINASDGDVAEIHRIQARCEVLVGLHEQHDAAYGRAQQPGQLRHVLRNTEIIVKLICA